MSTEHAPDQPGQGAEGGDDQARRNREEEIRRQVREAMGSRKRPAATPSGSPGTRAAGADNVDGPTRLRQMEEEEGGKLLPVLIGPSSTGRGKPLLDMGFLACEPLVPDRVFVALAFTRHTPHGTIGMAWFSRRHHTLLLGEPPFRYPLALASLNLLEGLRVGLGQYERGQVVRWERDDHFAASAVVLPDFYDRTSKRLQAQRLIVGIASADDVFVADADSVSAADVRGYTLEAGCDHDFLGPTVLLMDRSGTQFLADREV